MIKLFTRILVISLLAVLFAAEASQAQSNTTHTVQAGETLFSIAKKEGVSVQQIKQWNHLSGSKLSIGQRLMLKKKTAAGAPQSGITHTVKANETLYSISKEYGVGINEIKKWNDLQGQAISVGDRLHLYQKKSTASNQKDTPPSRADKLHYTVKSGDSLFRIAHAHNMSISRLKALNNLSSNNIQVGQKLELQPTDRPPSLSVAGVKSSSQGKFIRYTVKKSQPMKQLLNHFKMDQTEFKALNPGIDAESFRKGQTVTLLAPANRAFKNPYLVSTTSERLGSTTVTKYASHKITPTTSGELYNPKALTAAHPGIALGSVIYLQNARNNRGVLVRINDRTTSAGLKVSDAVWQALALTGGNARVDMYRSDE